MVTSSHDLLIDKLKRTTSTNGSDHVFSVSQTSELKSQTTSNDLSKPNNSNSLKDDTSSSCNSIEQTSQAQQQNGPQLLTKSKKYVKNLATEADQSVFDDSVNSSIAVSNANGQNVLFTISSGSDLSGVGSGVNREMVIGPTSSTTRCRPSLKEEDKNSALTSSRSIELPSKQSDMFVSL